MTAPTPDANTDTTGVPFAAYLEAVERFSNAIAAQREAVAAARAGVPMAGLRPDPSLSLGVGPAELGREVRPKPRLAQSIGLSYTIETGDKRERRVAAARSQVSADEAALAGAGRQAAADAAAAFIEACRTREALQRQEVSLAALGDIVRMNERRHGAGDLGGLELLQSRNERDQFLATVVRARADARTAMEALAAPLGRRWREAFGDASPLCTFRDGQAPEGLDGVEGIEGTGGSVGIQESHEDEALDALVARALDQRDDVRIARAAVDSARAAADLVRANRWVDPSVSLSYGYTPQGRRGVAADGSAVDPSPRSNTVSVSVSVPIPLSRLDRSDLVQAESAVTQALLALRQTELQAQADVRATHAQYRAALENLTRYRDATLGDARRVVEGLRLSYRHGAASLLELLSAQRAADDTELAYLQARSELAAATVRLQLSLGRAPAP
ncbi:TolC family protein [Mitsuaria sp. PDC51]|uniref:TolC family protein n=1 Tax=Mitsuaria sp. PDC51 TaxID=1881035 RepID=UPI0020C8BCC0|nr:TolC family protein [Mitsuaria sp. PDC51]